MYAILATVTSGKNVLEVQGPVQGTHFIPIRLCVLLK